MSLKEVWVSSFLSRFLSEVPVALPIVAKDETNLGPEVFSNNGYHFEAKKMGASSPTMISQLLSSFVLQRCSSGLPIAHYESIRRTRTS